MRNFQILIVYTVKISKQCLQTASASGVLRPPDPLVGLRSIDPTGGLPELQSPQ